jgi:hypothetical protein
MIDQVQAWRRLATEMGIDVAAPCRIVLSNNIHIEATAHVRDFGAPNGMVVDPDFEVLRPYREALIEAGYGYSGVELDDLSDRASIIDMLTDWSWASNRPRPTWWPRSVTRPLGESEKLIIYRIAERLPEDKRKQLLADAGNVTAVTANEWGSRIEFHIGGYQRPQYEGQRSFGVEGKVIDRDGVEIRIDLYADQNWRLLQLEFIRMHEDGTILGPDWKTLELF